MYWTRADLARLAYSQACRSLSDGARSQVPTVHDGYLQPGELLAEALGLRSHAAHIVQLAITAERARGCSWQQIADTLGMSIQVAREQYATVVEDIRDAILFAAREGRNGAPGWWACPEGVEDPDATARTLDAWVTRHREPTDPDRDERPVSDGLGRRSDHDVVDAIGRSLELADRLIARTLPEGVSERAAQRMLLEAKITAYDLIADRAHGERARDARRVAVEAFERLVAWHRSDLRERLGHLCCNDREVFITLDGRPLALLAHSDDVSDEDARGWFVWSLGDQSTTAPLCGLKPVPAVRAALLRAVGVADAGELVADVDVDAKAAIGRALDVVCEHVTRDAAKGVMPFAAGGIAGPPTAMDAGGDGIATPDGTPDPRTDA